MIVFPNGIQIEAVIFDFDGVIVDTEPLHYAAFERVLEPLGLHFTWEEYVETYIGFDDRDAFRHAFSSKGEILSQETLHSLIETKSSDFPGGHSVGRLCLSRCIGPDFSSARTQNSLGNMQRSTQGRHRPHPCHAWHSTTISMSL